MSFWNERVADATREVKLRAVWRKTHRDYKGYFAGVKSIMVLRNGGSTLVSLDDLTDQEIEERI